MKRYISNEETTGRGFWCAAGRANGRESAWPIQIHSDHKAVTFSLFGLLGFIVDWDAGIWVSFGVAYLFYAGAGWHRGYDEPVRGEFATYEVPLLPWRLPRG